MDNTLFQGKLGFAKTQMDKRFGTCLIKSEMWAKYKMRTKANTGKKWNIMMKKEMTSEIN